VTIEQVIAANPWVAPYAAYVVIEGDSFRWATEAEAKAIAGRALWFWL
jgi:hypothetical protein